MSIIANADNLIRKMFIHIPIVKTRYLSPLRAEIDLKARTSCAFLILLKLLPGIFSLSSYELS